MEHSIWLSLMKQRLILLRELLVMTFCVVISTILKSYVKGSS
ncbi:MAG: hypothetical protein ACLUOO_03090 [Coprococcus sp.]